MSSRRHLIDQGLFIYGALIAFVVTIVAFLNISSKTGLIAFILILPVSFYFLIRGLFATNFYLHRFFNKDLVRHHYFGDFRLKVFFDQSDIFFHITITLFSLALCLVMVRISLNLLK